MEAILKVYFRGRCWKICHENIWFHQCAETTLLGIMIGLAFGPFTCRLVAQPTGQVPTITRQTPLAPSRASLDCQTVITNHDEWLDGLGFALGTLASGNSISSPTQSSDPFSDLSKARFTETVDGKTRTFTLDPKETPSSLARRWSQFQTDLGRSEGTRLTPSRALYLYFGVSGSCGENSNLSLADLDGLRGTNELSFRNARLDFVSYRNAELWHTSFAAALLRHSDLSGSKFVECDFSGADLSGARLTGVSLGRGTVLKGTILNSTDLSGAYFEPSDVTDLILSNVTGLESLRFTVPTAAMKLRKALTDNGQTSAAREVTSAIYRNNLADEPVYSRVFGNYIQGGKLTHYGARPWNALVALLLLVPLFALAYAIALFSKGTSGN
jgi:uncharacterized protein YjbI with pentapeptide repeats